MYTVPVPASLRSWTCCFTLQRHLHLPSPASSLFRLETKTQSYSYSYPKSKNSFHFRISCERELSVRAFSSNSIMAAEKPVLYSYFRSGASWRLRVALAWKEIDYDLKPINLLKNEQTSEAYLKLNPMGQVPAFVINGTVLTQSQAILEFLEDLYPNKPLLPRDTIQKHKVREICEIIGSGIQPLQNIGVLVKYSDDVEKRTEWTAFWIDKGFVALEKVLKESSGKYCVGDELTLADVFLVPQVASAIRFKVDMSKFPTITKVNEELVALGAFQKADPFVQPDCPAELKRK